MTSDSEREIFMNGINFNPAQGNKTDDFVEKTVEKATKNPELFYNLEEAMNKTKANNRLYEYMKGILDGLEIVLSGNVHEHVYEIKTRFWHLPHMFNNALRDIENNGENKKEKLKKCLIWISGNEKREATMDIDGNSGIHRFFTEMSKEADSYLKSIKSGEISTYYFNYKYLSYFKGLEDAFDVIFHKGSAHTCIMEEMRSLIEEYTYPNFGKISEDEFKKRITALTSEESIDEAIEKQKNSERSYGVYEMNKDYLQGLAEKIKNCLIEKCTEKGNQTIAVSID